HGQDVEGNTSFAGIRFIVSADSFFADGDGHDTGVAADSQRQPRSDIVKLVLYPLPHRRRVEGIDEHGPDQTREKGEDDVGNSAVQLAPSNRSMRCGAFSRRRVYTRMACLISMAWRRQYIGSIS